jgi:hypothetical protein
MNQHYNFIIILVIGASLVLVNGCTHRIGNYVAASSISKNGYARNGKLIHKINGSEIKVWGYVDHGNIFADGADEISADWISGSGPSPTTWRFGLKAKPNDATGASFMVSLPNDKDRDKLLRAFITDAKTGKPTKVFIKGKIFTFDAPINFTTITGLKMEVKSTNDILLEPPNEK